MGDPVRVLIIEDSDDDAVLLAEELRRGGFDPDYTRVETAAELEQALAEREFDIIISDYSLPQFNGMEALRIVQRSGVDVPFIIVSGSVQEPTIVEAMRSGARDYVMKSNLMRLPLAVRRELEEAVDRRRRLQMDEQLRHTQRLESLGVLAGGVAHDFNNLLTGVLGNASLALEIMPDNSTARPLIEHVTRAAEQAAQLTRQLLAYAGKGRFLVEPLDISEVIADARPLLSISVSRHISLVFDLRADLPAIEADRGQVQQVLVNLVTNAAEAIGMENSGAILVQTGTQYLEEAELATLVIRDRLQPGEFVFLEVRDSGPGMDAATRARIFDPFFTTKFTGRGLGLSAVLGILRGHKGTLKVESAPGHGTTFAVYFPSTGQSRTALARARQERLQPAAGSVILVVDDEETVRETARAVLERHGLEALTAASGSEAMAKFAENPDGVSAVLLDLTMPNMTGQETLDRIQAIRPDVPVIMTSGHSESEATERLRGKHIAGFLQKPYDAAQLMDVVGAALQPAGSPR